jgi:hypothetical protein
MLIGMFLCILTLENEALRSFETSVTAHLSTETRIQGAMNPHKRRCENLKCSKCDTAFKTEKLKERCINVGTRKADWTEVAWSDRGVESWS